MYRAHDVHMHVPPARRLSRPRWHQQQHLEQLFPDVLEPYGGVWIRSLDKRLTHAALATAMQQGPPVDMQLPRQLRHFASTTTAWTQRLLTQHETLPELAPNRPERAKPARVMHHEPVYGLLFFAHEP